MSARPEVGARGEERADPQAGTGARTRRRLLLFSFIADNRWSGMGNWTHSIADALRAEGHDVTLWFAADFPRAERAGRLAVLLHPIAFALRALRRRREFDAVVVHEPSGAWYGLLRRLAPGLPPMVAMCHNVESHSVASMRAAARRGQAANTGGVRYHLFRRWQSNLTIRLADHVVCLSSVDRAYIIERLGRSSASVSVMLNGVVPAGAGAPAVLRDGDAPTVAFVGGWLDIKGRRVLPPLWAEVRRRIPAARLTLIGTGQPASEVLRDFADADRASLEVIPRIADNDALLATLARHRVLVMPSLSEGSPLVLLEAMDLGLAAVASRVGGIPDLVHPGETALLFDPAEPEAGAHHVVALLQDGARAAAVGRAAQAAVRERTWEAAAEVLLDAVRSAGR